MEELRSTEILDKEIQSDARKKAEKILISAERDCNAIKASVSSRISDAKKELSGEYSKKLEQFRHDMTAAIPLEKKRYLVLFSSEAVNKAINTYMKKLTDSKRFELIKNMFKRCQHLINGKKINAQFYGIGKTKVNTFLKKELGDNLISCKETDFEKTGQDDFEYLTIHVGIILESDDLSIRCRLTIEELVSEIKDKYNRELVDELFKGREMNG